MSQTEELRAELDRLKIKWWEDDWDSSHRTVFNGANGVRYCAYEFCGILYLMTRLPVTVEQAIAVTVGERNPDGLPIGLTISNDGNLLNWIGENYVRQDAATVGAGTCHDADVGGYFVCSECEALVKLHSIGRSYVDGYGKRWYATSNNHSLNFCPNCGRRIEVNE